MRTQKTLVTQLMKTFFRVWSREGPRSAIQKALVFLFDLFRRTSIAQGSKNRGALWEWNANKNHGASSRPNFPLFRTSVLNEQANHLLSPDDVLFLVVVTDKFTVGAESLLMSLKRWVSEYPRVAVVCDEQLSEFSRQRLLEVAGDITFITPVELDLEFEEFENHKRIGKVGYFNISGLGIFEPEYVIILDSDLLVTGDISDLWRTPDKVVVAEDSGVQAKTTMSALTGRNVLNSGVIGLPRSIRNPEVLAEALKLAAKINSIDDESLNRFADQKFWNVFLKDKKIRILESTLNLNKSRLEDNFDDLFPYTKVAHFTGVKPWRYLESGADDLYDKHKKLNKRSFELWRQSYDTNRLASRFAQFASDERPSLRETLESLESSKRVQLVGNGPSLLATISDIKSNQPVIAFNWFVKGEAFDSVQPDHLIVSSHLFFGGWMTMNPTIPLDWKKNLLNKKHKPHLWFPYYFKNYIDSQEWLMGYKKSYYFFEKPGRVEIASVGNWDFDLTKPLVDCHTGLLTVGIPLAKHFKPIQIALFGFDGSYNASTRGRYFYQQKSEIADASTSAATLSSSWSPGGKARFASWVAHQHLKHLGVELFHESDHSKVTEIPSRGSL